MPDQKISQLTGGGAAQATDEIPIARSGSNFKLTGANIAAAATSVGTLSSLTVSGAASIQTLAASGQSLTGSQATSLVDLAATWNTTGTPTAIKLNVTDTASNASSLLMDLQVGGTSQLRMNKQNMLAIGAAAGNGALNFGSVNINTAFPTLGFYNSFTSLMAAQNGADALLISAVATTLWQNTAVLWLGQAQDTGLRRDGAAAVLAQRNSTNAQTFRLYNTFTDASNYERGKLEWASNVLRIGTEKLGTGTARALELQTDGTTRVTVNTDGSTTFASHLNLPANCRFNVSGAPSITAVWGAAELRLAANYNLGWSINPGDATSPLDLALVKDAAWTLALRSGTNAQTFNIYNTFTSSTNYERLSIAATSAGAVRIRTNKGSGGGTARALELGTDDTTRVTIPTTGGCVVGTAALATNATDGFLYVPTCAGTPTGTPTAQTGTVPIVVDTTNNKLYFYSGAAWRDAGP